MRRLLLSFAIFSVCHAVWAGEADVLDVQVSCSGDSICRFSATVKHADEGWKHYADAWEILTLQGDVLGVRELAHPHDNEQPFTRSLGGVKIPKDVTEVEIRARDSVHGYGGERFKVRLPR
ncbi:MAG: hypothetical protein MI754_15665 [Chromatiales bacterium]|nr:hypothetical protein [Chromatiales bacterium]